MSQGQLQDRLLCQISEVHYRRADKGIEFTNVVGQGLPDGKPCLFSYSSVLKKLFLEKSFKWLTKSFIYDTIDGIKKDARQIVFFHFYFCVQIHSGAHL